MKQVKGSLLYKRTTQEHLTLFSVRDDVKPAPYERVSEAFGVNNHAHILHTLKYGDPVLRRRVLKALDSVLKLPQELVMSIKHGVLALVEREITAGVGKSMSESESELQELSARVFSVIAESPCGKAEILKSGMIIRIKPAFASTPNKRTCQHLYDALLHMSSSAAGAPQLTQAEYISVVLKQLNGCRLNDALRTRALKLLKKLLNDGTDITIFYALEQQVVPQCAKQLHSPNPKVQVAACGVLEVLGFVDKARKEVVEQRAVVPRLCTMLTNPQWKVASASAGALMSLAAHDEIKQQIVTKEGIAPLKQLLQTDQAHLQLHTTKLIAVLASLPVARKELVTLEVTTKLIMLIRHEDSLLSESAKVALAAVQWQP